MGTSAGAARSLAVGGRSRSSRATQLVQEQISEQKEATMRSRMATVRHNEQQEQEHISALVEVSAEELEGMRRQLEHPEPEQVERVRRFLAATPSPPRA
jgi:hypothetical protein